MAKKKAGKAKKATGLGNTETQPQVQHIKWCFTYNNYELDDIKKIEEVLTLLCKCYCFKKEIGAEGTNHLQGHITLLKKCCLNGLKKHDIFSKFHWEVKKGSEIENDIYICKSETSLDNVIYQYGYIKKLHIIQPLKLITILRPFQQQVIDLINKKDDRTIHWIYDETGFSGKTQLMKYIAYYYNSICCSSGKDSDIYNLFWNYIDGKEKNVILLNNLDCFIYNVARNHTFKQYTLLENIKDGYLNNTKYETGSMNFNGPSIVILANHLPDKTAMTMDRWNIIII